ncbi:polysaccharide deacetylase [Ulvibacter antarcticus]|uniref:Polysaccharide deacetylase n=1 Tax=Ulvibacter antarcticus TaxID=442714 RepID=A0A3L9YDM6_9FLAO|nr:polysaccharide deacetylase [Ulvibacter antarcticus]
MSKLAVLMYHDVSTVTSEALTISVEKLEEQFAWLVEKGYKSYHCKELMELQKLPAKKNILITFDDGYVSQMELAVPLLEKYNLKATFFVPLNYLGKTDQWNTSALSIMTSEDLLSLNPQTIELAFHSYYHKKYNELTEVEIEADTQLCFNTVSEKKLPFSAAVAYPYGKYPRETSEKKKFFQQLKKQQFHFGFRIGNRLNDFPFKNPFEIQRIDVKGEFSLSKFKRKVKFGKIF